MHTPGPWYIGAQNDDLYIIVGEKPSPSNDYQRHDANRIPIAKVYDPECANILAAAPDLLEALESMLGEACKQNWNDNYPEQVKKARAAIKKAVASSSTL